MRALALIGTLAVLLIGGAVTVAAAPAAPAPAAKGSPAPSATPRPTRAPASTPAGSTTGGNGSVSNSGTATGTLQASLQPLNVIAGSVSLTTNPNGTGTLVLDTSGLGGSQPWHVYLDPGRVTDISAAARHEFAFTSGRDFTMFTSEVATIPLTKAQMTRLNADVKASGAVTANITDGIRHSVAYLQ